MLFGHILTNPLITYLFEWLKKLIIREIPVLQGREVE